MGNLATVGETEFAAEVLQSPIPVLVDFFAVWCNPCKMMAPIVDQLAQDFAGKVKFVQVDIDQSPKLAEEYGVQGVPTFILFKGGQPTGKMTGARPRDNLLAAIRALI